MQRTSNPWGGTERARGAARVLIIAALAMTMLIATAFVPAGATSGGDDIEEVRAAVLETFNYKISLLANRKAETSNEDRKAVYQGGIDELTSLRDGRVLTEDSIDELWALKDQAHAIYHETLNAAEQVGMTPAEELEKAKQKARDTIAYKITLLEKWIEGCDDAEARSIVAGGINQLEALYGDVENAETPDEAYAVKNRAHEIYHATIDRAEKAKGDDDTDEEEDDEKDEKTEAEKAAEALAKARRATLSLIERKAAILTSTAAAARIPAVEDVFAAAAEAVLALEDDARAAKSTTALKEIDEQVMAIYEQAKADAEAIRVEYEGDEELDTLTEYLDQLARSTKETVNAAERTADDSPETYEALVDAKDEVLAAIDNVREVADSGTRLGDRWDRMELALRGFRQALIRHYIALGEPMNLEGLNIPG